MVSAIERFHYTYTVKKRTHALMLNIKSAYRGLMKSFSKINEKHL